MAGRKIRPYESEVSWRDFKPLAPSKRSKALQKELERRRPHGGVGTRPWQAKRTGYMDYERDGSRAKRRRYSSEFAKEWERGVKSARFTEYMFRYPSERDLERKAQEKREEREKYQLRRRLERLERGPRHRSGYSKWFHGPENPFRARKNSFRTPHPLVTGEMGTEEYLYPSVQFKKNSEEADKAVREAWSRLSDARDALGNYFGLYKALLRDLPDEGEWQEAHETAKRQLGRIEHVALKELAELDHTFNVMADDIRVLLYNLPPNPHWKRR